MYCTISNKNISETSGPIVIKFYLKHQWGGGKAALGFGVDRLRTLVFMAATDSSHMVIMGKTVLQLFLGYFSSDLFIFAGKENMHEGLDGGSQKSLIVKIIAQ